MFSESCARALSPAFAEEASAALTVRPVTSRRDLARWIRFPQRIYAPDGPWVAPLEREIRRRLSRKNPFFGYGNALPLLAVDRAGELHGRILAHVNSKHNKVHSERTAFFGYFECRDDPVVANALLSTAADFGRAQGCDMLRGPFNMTAYQELGIMLEGFDRSQSIAEVHTAPYYPRLLEAFGLRQCRTMSTVLNPELQKLDPEKILGTEYRGLPDNPALSVRTVRLKRFQDELRLLREIMNECFLRNWHYLPLSQEEVQFEYGGLKLIVRRELMLVAEHAGLPVGFVVCLPDLYQFLRPLRGRLSPLALLRFRRQRDRIRRASVMAIGVRDRYRSRGVIQLMLYRLVQTLQRLGYTSLAGTWIDDRNAASRAVARLMEAKPKHRMAIYERRI
jgi:hypothetical protein